MKIVVYIIVFITSYAGVEAFRRWGLRRDILDLPNERSSHIAPVPVGGGFVTDFISLITLASYCLFFNIEYFRAYFVGAILIAGISWLDDLYSIPIVWRFFFQVSAAGLVIWDLGYWERVYLPFGGTFDFGVFGLVITFLWIVWLINAYNFMDGIDGIAGAQAVVGGLGWLVIGMLENFENTGFYGGVIALSGIGFLAHNWQPAKIFMGDVGSAFLGYTFAVMPLLAKKESSEELKIEQDILPLAAATLVSLFLFDSLLTLLRRLLRGEKVWQPHREHIYQKLVVQGLSHQKITCLYTIISAVAAVALIFRMENREARHDWVFLLILSVFGVLLIYSYGKKTISRDY